MSTVTVEPPPRTGPPGNAQRPREGDSHQSEGGMLMHASTTKEGVSGIARR